MSASVKHGFFFLRLFASDVWSFCTTTLDYFTSKTINGIIDSLSSFRELTSANIGWLEVHAHCVRAGVGLTCVDSQATAISHRKTELINKESDLSRK